MHFPSRISTDEGLENFAIAQYMIQNQGINRESVIAGKRAHIKGELKNCGGMRMRCCHQLFYFMEEEDILDPLSELQLAAPRLCLLAAYECEADHLEKCLWSSSHANNSINNCSVMAFWSS